MFFIKKFMSTDLLEEILRVKSVPDYEALVAKFGGHVPKEVKLQIITHSSANNNLALARHIFEDGFYDLLMPVFVVMNNYDFVDCFFTKGKDVNYRLIEKCRDEKILKVLRDNVD